VERSPPVGRRGARVVPVRPLWKQRWRDLAAIAENVGVTADQVAAVLEAAGTTTWHHFEKPPAGSEPAALPLFAAGDWNGPPRGWEAP